MVSDVVNLHPYNMEAERGEAEGSQTSAVVRRRGNLTKLTLA